MNRIAGVMKMHYRDKFTWLYLPWIIVLSSFTINLIIGIITGGRNDIYTGGVSSIYVYMLVVGIITLSQTFPFALGLSVRRKDFFWGTAFMLGLVSAFSAIVLLILTLIENSGAGGWGIKLHFFHLPYLNDGPIYAQLWIYFALLGQMYFLGFAISSVYRRFGRNGLFVFFIALSLLISIGAFVCTYNNWWVDIFNWFSHHTAFQLTLWMIPLIAVYALVSYLLLRKATI